MAGWVLSAIMVAVAGNGSDCTILHFTADWCQPCKLIEPSLRQLESDGFQIQTVDCDRQSGLVQQFRIQNLPTLVILSGDREVDRIVGASGYDVISSRVQRVAARSRASTNPSIAAAATAPQPETPQPTVRGQSPSLGAFPMLAASTNSMLASAARPTDRIPNNRGSIDSSKLSPSQAVARASAATVRIRVDEGNTTAFGTGTIIDTHGDEALVLTCGHLFRDMRAGSQLTIDFMAGTPQESNLPAQLVDFKAEDEDIGLVSFRVPMPVAPVPLLLPGEKPQVGQAAFSFGCDHGEDPTRRDTRIKSINRYIGADNIEIEGAPAVGRSGGGLFDMQGRLIGVCNAAVADGDEGIYAAASVIYDQVQRLGLSRLLQPSPAAGTSPVQLATNRNVAASQAAPLTQSSARSAAPQSVTAPYSGAAPPTSPALSQIASAEGADQVSPIQELDWPTDSDAGRALALSGEQPLAASNTAATQLICIVRNASGQDEVVTVERPSSDLLRTIQQQARR